jgi:predicted GIY-YIG superfamily endonuclease
MPELVLTDHSCYILLSQKNGSIYIGYTTDFKHRLRQHNGEIKGGAKKTSKHRPWVPICLIRGFLEKSSALRFEYRLQRLCKKRSTLTEDLKWLINNGDGSVKNNNKMNWPIFLIIWYNN